MNFIPKLTVIRKNVLNFAGCSFVDGEGKRMPTEKASKGAQIHRDVTSKLAKGRGIAKGKGF